MHVPVLRVLLAAALCVSTALFLNPAVGRAATPSVVIPAGTYSASVTVIPGEALQISGGGFTSSEQVTIRAPIPLYSGTTHVITAVVTADARGNFYGFSVQIPANARAGTATLTVRGQRSGRQGQAALRIQYQPGLTLSSTTLGPGQALVVRGHGFVPNSPVEVTIPINRVGTFAMTLRQTVYAGSGGNIAATITLPSDIAAGNYTVTAVDGVAGLRATARLTVQRARVPTATSTPTATPTSVPATATPIPTPPPLPSNSSVGFQWVSLWYHTVQAGTWDQIVVQGKPHRKFGIWVHVIFPNGLHYDYYENTDDSGQWSKRFTIPKKATTQYSNQGQVQLQLWRGSHTVKTYVTFTIVG